MGKTRDLVKKIRDTKGTFHAKMSLIKDKKWSGPNRSRRNSLYFLNINPYTMYDF